LKDSSLQVFEQLLVKKDRQRCIILFLDAFSAVASEVVIDLVFPLKTFKVHEDYKVFISGRINKQVISKRDKLYQQTKTNEFRS
jgi:hypothetical protein